MLFLVYVWTARSHRGAFAAFPKKWKMPDKCPPLRILLPSGGGGEDADVRLELWLTHKA